MLKQFFPKTDGIEFESIDFCGAFNARHHVTSSVTEMNLCDSILMSRGKIEILYMTN